MAWALEGHCWGCVLAIHSGPCSVTSIGVALAVSRCALLLGCQLILVAYCISLYLLFSKLVTVEEQQFLREPLYNTGILIVWDPAPYHAEIHEVRLSKSDSHALKCFC